MKICFACKKESYPGCGVSFFRLPTNPELREKWLEVLKENNVLPAKVTPNLNLCGRHFAREDQLMHLSKATLKPNTIPSIFNIEKRHSHRPHSIAGELRMLPDNHVALLDQHQDATDCSDDEQHEEEDIIWKREMLKLGIEEEKSLPMKMVCEEVRSEECGVACSWSGEGGLVSRATQTPTTMISTAQLKALPQLAHMYPNRDWPRRSECQLRAQVKALSQRVRRRDARLASMAALLRRLLDNVRQNERGEYTL